MLTPNSIAGNAPQTITRDTRAKQLLVDNLDPTNSFTVKINDDTGPGKTLNPGEHLGLRDNAGFYKVIITPVAGTPAFEVLFL